jgi:SAM-dependent methyltransferase
MDVARWNSDADIVDLTLLAGVTGPMLDIGCGPGRMVRAAIDLGLSALGIDVSPTAVEIARAHGIRVLERNVFAPIPAEGHWQTALLVDGNIGIGGDVANLVGRCAQLIAPGGELVVEVHADPDRHHTYVGTLVDDRGRASESFPWAEIGLDRLAEVAAGHGLAVLASWHLGGRHFCRLG